MLLRVYLFQVLGSIYRVEIFVMTPCEVLKCCVCCRWLVLRLFLSLWKTHTPLTCLNNSKEIYWRASFGQIVAKAVLKKLHCYVFLWSFYICLICGKSTTDTIARKKKNQIDLLKAWQTVHTTNLQVLPFCFYKKCLFLSGNCFYRLWKVNPIWNWGKIPSGSSWGGERKSLVCGKEFVYRQFGCAALAISCLCYGPPCYATSQIKVIITANTSKDNIYARSQSQSPSGLRCPLDTALVLSHQYGFHP